MRYGALTCLGRLATGLQTHPRPAALCGQYGAQPHGVQQEYHITAHLDPLGDDVERVTGGKSLQGLQHNPSVALCVLQRLMPIRVRAVAASHQNLSQVQHASTVGTSGSQEGPERADKVQWRAATARARAGAYRNSWRGVERSTQGCRVSRPLSVAANSNTDTPCYAAGNNKLRTVCRDVEACCSQLVDC